MKTVPQTVPQRYANQALHARYAAHARAFFVSGFVSVENKERCIYLPKLKVASSSLVARSNFLSKTQSRTFENPGKADLSHACPTSLFTSLGWANVSL